MIELQIGTKIVGLEGPDDRDKLSDLAKSPQAKFLAAILADVAADSAEMSRNLLGEGKYDEARAENAYARALEGVAELLTKGISEALKENS